MHGDGDGGEVPPHGVNKDGDGEGSQCIGMGVGGSRGMGTMGRGGGRGRQGDTAPPPPCHPRSRSSGTPRPEQNKEHIEAVGPGGAAGGHNKAPSVPLSPPQCAVTARGDRGLRADRGQIRTCPRIPVSLRPCVPVSPCPRVPLSLRPRVPLSRCHHAPALSPLCPRSVPTLPTCGGGASPPGGAVSSAAPPGSDPLCLTLWCSGSERTKWEGVGGGGEGFHLLGPRAGWGGY